MGIMEKSQRNTLKKTITCVKHKPTEMIHKHTGLGITISGGGKMIDYVYLEGDHLFSLWNIAQRHDNVGSLWTKNMYLCNCAILHL